MEINHPPIKKSLPWWTWVAPLLVFQAGTQIALHFRYIGNVSAIYLPIPFAIILVNWWGIKRVAPAIYINSFISTPLWGNADIFYWFIYPIPETLLTIVSWFFFSRLGKGKYWLPDAKETVRFLWIGVIIPLAIDLTLLQIIITSMPSHATDKFLDNVLRNFFGGLSIAIPITFGFLYLVTPRLQRKGLLYNPPPKILPVQKKMSLAESILLTCIYAGLFIFSLKAPFDKFWFVYGLMSLSISLRFGFGEACRCIVFVFIVTFIVPAFTKNVFLNDIFKPNSSLYFVLIGNLLMSVFAAVTGRVISDLSITEEELNTKNQELQQTNEELDLFVYSVSHDLSAPLKSVQGLVNVSRLDDDPTKKDEYLTKISQSVTKLDSFIKEVLDYSQNKRHVVVPEKIDLHSLAQEILSNLEHLENFSKIEVDLSGLSDQITTDRLRLKMILNNVISNAVKFQKRLSDEKPFIKISSWMRSEFIEIQIADNGEGIDPKVQPKIFDMFYRGTLNSKGSGLGLFIAKEAAIKLGGSISVESEYGKGSLFKIVLRKNMSGN